jgi:hypothetical protein
MDELEYDNDSKTLITDRDIIMKGGAYSDPPVRNTRNPRNADSIRSTTDPGYLNNTPPNNMLNADLLQILESGVNAIVVQIKQKLGNNITTTNANAKKIVELLNSISTKITTNITTIGSGDTTIKVAKDATGLYKDTKAIDATYYGIPNEITINLPNTHSGYHGNLLLKQKELGGFTTRGTGDKRFTAAEQTLLPVASTNVKIDMNTLDNEYNSYLGAAGHTNANPTSVIENPEFDLVIAENRKKVENRLANCQLLEMLYLIKHEELIKTFTFTLNLFDKYKYSIKILLFVLKNLVNKALPGPGGVGVVPGGPIAVKIKLPKVLIQNITKLLDDQKQVQDVVNLMKDTLDETINTIPGDPLPLGSNSRTSLPIPIGKTSDQKTADARLHELSSGAAPANPPVEDPTLNTKLALHPNVLTSPSETLVP